MGGGVVNTFPIKFLRLFLQFFINTLRILINLIYNSRSNSALLSFEYPVKPRSLASCLNSLTVGISLKFKARVTDHLKHSSSLFCMLIIVFLPARQSESGIYEDPFRGLYSTAKIFRLTVTIDLNLQPL